MFLIHCKLPPRTSPPGWCIASAGRATCMHQYDCAELTANQGPWARPFTHVMCHAMTCFAIMCCAVQVLLAPLALMVRAAGPPRFPLTICWFICRTSSFGSDHYSHLYIADCCRSPSTTGDCAACSFGCIHHATCCLTSSCLLPRGHSAYKQTILPTSEVLSGPCVCTS